HELELSGGEEKNAEDSDLSASGTAVGSEAVRHFLRRRPKDAARPGKLQPGTEFTRDRPDERPDGRGGSERNLAPGVLVVGRPGATTPPCPSLWPGKALPDHGRREGSRPRECKVGVCAGVCAFLEVDRERGIAAFYGIGAAWWARLENRCAWIAVRASVRDTEL